MKSRVGRARHFAIIIVIFLTKCFHYGNREQDHAIATIQHTISSVIVTKQKKLCLQAKRKRQQSLLSFLAERQMIKSRH